MNEEKEKFIRALKAIDITTELFYQQKSKEGYGCFEDIINCVTELINYMSNQKGKEYNVDINEKEITSILYNAMQSMEANDTILLADILQYELKEEIQRLMNLYIIK